MFMIVQNNAVFSRTNTCRTTKRLLSFYINGRLCNKDVINTENSNGTWPEIPSKYLKNNLDSKNLFNKKSDHFDYANLGHDVCGKVIESKQDLNSSQNINKTRRYNYLTVVLEHLDMYATPSSLSYFWSFGSLAGVFLVIQIITGIILVMHYKPSSLGAFVSVLHLMNDVESGWLMRYTHANGASFFFFMLYAHIARGLYYGSFMTPRNWLWISGICLFFLAMGTGFIGYVLPWGQMSYWGATVITNLISAIPYIGRPVVTWVWGNFFIGDSTLNRFFSLHYLLPFIVLVVMFVHLYLLHSAGSDNPLGLPTEDEFDKIPFYFFFYLKDLVAFFCIVTIYLYFIFFSPNALGHSDNYILANELVTPAHIVPEWYFLPFYAILRAIPDKLGGIIAMVAAIYMQVLHTTMCVFERLLLETDYKRPMSMLIVNEFYYWCFVGNFIFLGFIGSRPVETPYLELGQASTVFFFLYWVIAPLLYAVENQYMSWMDGSLSLSKKN